MAERLESKFSTSSVPTEKLEVKKLSRLGSKTKSRIKTGIYEFDRVLGGGFIPGGVVFLSGEPGVGKSTLLLQSLYKLNTLYISGEEAAEQIKDRSDRLKIESDKFLFSNDVQVEGIVDYIESEKDKPDIVVIDSIQTVYSKDIDSPPGTINQLKEATNKLIACAKQVKIPVILIGHITKDGDIAGPKTLEHLVDCVLSFEGDEASQFRILRSTKNRFGSTDEIGIFEMKETGLHEVSNPLIFLEDTKIPTPGKAIVAVMEGKRPLYYEIQTLVVPTALSIPRRVVKGVDYNKVQLLLAVMKKHLGLQLDSYDVYVNVIGGVKITSTLADFGAIASLYSSLRNIAVKQNTLFIGEVGLLGEVRKSYQEEKIIQESKRLMFKNIYSSKNTHTIKQIREIIV